MNMKKIAAAGIAAATLIGLAACGNQTSKSADSKTNEKAELVFWGWDPGNGYPQIIKQFEKENPGVTIKFTNTGTSKDTTTSLANAIQAGKGAPDVVMLEDTMLPQFAVSKGIADLAKFDAGKLEDDFVAGPWSKVHVDGKVFGLPIDSAPEMFFYNKKVFDKAGVDGSAIKTWDDYYQAAKKLRKIGAYITNNSGSSNEYQPFVAQAWQAGANPWKVSGSKITIDMTNDEGLNKYIDFQQKLIDEGLVDTKVANWSDDWNHGLNDGSIASLTIGAWMPVNLMKAAPDQAGNWRAAQLPQWTEGATASGEDGGSALAVVAQSKHQELAYKFAKYVCDGGGSQTMVDTGTFPSLKKLLNDKSFVDPTTANNKKLNEYFGGQNVNEVLVAAAKLGVSKFGILPYNPFAQTAYGDQVSKAYSKQITLKEAIKNFAKALADQGKSDGYDVTLK